jgi:hypothetical protein
MSHQQKPTKTQIHETKTRLGVGIRSMRVALPQGPPPLHPALQHKPLPTSRKLSYGSILHAAGCMAVGWWHAGNLRRHVGSAVATFPAPTATVSQRTQVCVCVREGEGGGVPSGRQLAPVVHSLVDAQLHMHNYSAQGGLTHHGLQAEGLGKRVGLDGRWKWYCALLLGTLFKVARRGGEFREYCAARRR